MRIRTFQATGMQEAMEEVRRNLGEDAIILSSEKLRGGKGVVITVAIDEDAEEDRFIAPTPELQDEIVPPTPNITEGAAAWDRIAMPNGNAISPGSAAAIAKTTVKKPASTTPGHSTRADVSAARQQQLREIENILRYHSTPQALQEKLLETARFLPLPPGQNFAGIKRAVAQIMDVFFPFAPLLLEEDHRVMLVGPPGVGKTMTIAKLAARLVREGRKVNVISTDISRAGGIEQLQSLMTILGVQVHVAESKQALKNLLAELPAADCTLIDSAGVNPYAPEELKELADFLAIGGIEPVLVLPAGMDAQESEFTARAFSVIAEVKHLLATRTDVSRRYGNLMGACHALGAALCHASGSPKVLGDFTPLNADIFSNLLMQHRLDTTSNSEQAGSHRS
jgi:flagellar biosynthesis protein FlhF